MTLISENIDEFKALIKPNDILLGIDYGEKKIGLAISSPSRQMAVPLAIIANNQILFEELKKIVTSRDIKGIIVGIPINMDGTYGPSALKAKTFAENLSKVLSLSIFLQDERRTSKAADSLLLIAGYNRRQRNNMDDSIAASLILESAIKSLDN